MITNPLAVTTITYLPYSLDQALDGIRAAGFRYVELAALPGICEHVSVHMDAAAVDGVRAALDSYGLTPLAVSAHADLTTPDGAAFTGRALAMASALGATILNTAVGGPSNENEDAEAFLANVGQVAELASQWGITLTLEIHGRLTANGALTAELVRRVNHAHVRVNYDTANCIYYGDTLPYEDLQVALPATAYVHLKDKRGGPRVWDFPALGAGELDLPRILRILQSGGYAGPLCVEIEFDSGPYPPLAEVNDAVAQSFAYLQQISYKPGVSTP
jgi:sugar phosphate isomerase/epimerase